MLSKRISLGVIIPKFYGVSYRDYPTEETICHPFPFNLLISWLRPKWLMIRYGRVKWETAVELKYQQKLHDTEQHFYEMGMIAGHKDGYDQGFHAGVQKTLEKNSDILEVIKTYAINLLKLYLMRVQIPGNEMTDEVRSSFSHFLKYEKQYKPKITSRLITSLFSPDKNDMSDGMSDIDYYILDRFCQIMKEDLRKMNG